MFCSKCGYNAGDSKFCANCGTPIAQKQTGDAQNTGAGAQYYQDAQPQHSDSDFTKKVKETFEEMTGGKNDDVSFKLTDLWSDIFKKHTTEESDSLLISGTCHTTPSLRELCTEWNRPWIYSRVFLVLIITFGLLSACTYFFGNMLALPGVMFIGALTMPFTLLVLFWETNIPRNISIFRLVIMFFIGGVASLVFTLFLFTFISPGEGGLDYVGATIVGIVEELGKLGVVFLLIRIYDSKYILNGILIGAAVGAGFAAFESAGYALVYGGDLDGIIHNIILRGLLAAGGHIVWAAISGAAVMLAKGDGKADVDVFKSGKFWRLFPVPVVLHAVWDMPFSSTPVLIGLTVLAWVFVLALIRSGMSQVSHLCVEAAKEEGTAD